MTVEIDSTLRNAMCEALEREQRKGFVAGLAVAEQIRDWLTRQPDRAWQAEVRGWAEAAISDAKRKAGIE